MSGKTCTWNNNIHLCGVGKLHPRAWTFQNGQCAVIRPSRKRVEKVCPFLSVILYSILSFFTAAKGRLAEKVRESSVVRGKCFQERIGNKGGRERNWRQTNSISFCVWPNTTHATSFRLLYRPFHNFGASKSVARRFWTASNSLISGSLVSEIVKGPVGHSYLSHVFSPILTMVLTLQ